PYFLYGASNLGSMLALASYPLWIEPNFRLLSTSWSSQSGLWTVGYVLLIALTGVCALILWKSPQHAPSVLAPASVGKKIATAVQPIQERGPSASALKSKAALPTAAAPEPASPTLPQRLRWVALAFVPSSLMLGVTTYITTDIAAIPLLWVPPLALYLLSFI